jgi:hypothetical protein
LTHWGKWTERSDDAGTLVRGDGRGGRDAAELRLRLEMVKVIARLERLDALLGRLADQLARIAARA